MIQLCKEAGVPEPDFELRDGFFVLTLWREPVTAQAVRSPSQTRRAGVSAA
jgi:hypothetical protein